MYIFLNMKKSLVLISFFVSGIVFGVLGFLPSVGNLSLSEYALYLLLLLVGISIGADPNTWKTVRSLNMKILLVPLSVVIGSLLGGFVSSLLLQGISAKDALAVSSGFGYYSLSSILITKFYSETIGAVALLANITREVLTLIFTPLLAKHIGKLAPIAAGGATSMDTSLPIITQTVGKHYGLISLCSGILLSILVPILVLSIIEYL